MQSPRAERAIFLNSELFLSGGATGLLLGKSFTYIRLISLSRISHLSFMISKTSYVNCSRKVQNMLSSLGEKIISRNLVLKKLQFCNIFS